MICICVRKTHVTGCGQRDVGRPASSQSFIEGPLLLGNRALDFLVTDVLLLMAELVG